MRKYWWRTKKRSKLLFWDFRWWIVKIVNDIFWLYFYHKWGPIHSAAPQRAGIMLGQCRASRRESLRLARESVHVDQWGTAIKLGNCGDQSITGSRIFKKPIIFKILTKVWAKTDRRVRPRLELTDARHRLSPAQKIAWHCDLNLWTKIRIDHIFVTHQSTKHFHV